jgi:hypothetical protein
MIEKTITNEIKEVKNEQITNAEQIETMQPKITYLKPNFAASLTP